MKKKLLIPMLLLLLASSLWSLKIGGKMLPDTMKLGDNVLVLNGAGLRKKLIIKVYAGALYLPQPTDNAAQVINSDIPMAVKMHFIYKSVDPAKLIEAWNTGFAKSDISNLKEQITQFNAMFSADAKKDDVYDITYLPDTGSSLYINGKLIGTVPGFEFKKALFSIWFGNETELPKLRDRMLGK